MSQAFVEKPNLESGAFTELPDRERWAPFRGVQINHFTERAFPGLFEDQAAKAADRIAVICENDQFTFRELNARANQLARHLRGLGVGRESLVGICVDRSLEMVVGILGILKSGAAYLPLDPDYPPERLAFMLDDARPALVLAKSKLLAQLPQSNRRVLLLDGDWPAIAENADDNLPETPRANDLAYVIYTSGSTGAPKGVMIEHGNLANYLLALNHELHVTGDDFYLHTASIAFSSSRRQLMLPLSQGATVVIATSDQRKDPLALFEMIKSRGVTVMDAVPSFWRTCTSMLEALDQEQRQSLLDNRLRLMLSASEPLFSDIPHTWMSRFHHPARHVHMFGQTETAGIVALYRVPTEIDDELNVLPIGKPIANSEIYILDKKQQPCPVDIAGELYIGGAGVGRGYLNRPELTTEKFIPHPFEGQEGARLYRTGDWARYRADGQIEFTGRRDQQVKLRGFRIELGEVEAALARHPSISENAVITRPDDRAGTRLIAYFVSNGQADSAPNAGELRNFLSDRLPEYAIPSVFVRMDALPLSANGKLNRLALPEPDDLRSGLSTEFVAPQNEIEKRLAAIWSQVLRVERIGRDDNFFELGGHSLLAAQIVSRICQEFKVQIALRILFEAPTLAQIAGKVVAALAIEQPASLPQLQPVARGNKVPLSFAQQRLWFMNQLEPDGASYNICRAFRIRGALDVGKLQRAVDEIVKRHEILRTNFVSDDGQPLQVISPSMRLPIEVTDLSGLATGEREVELRHLTVADGQEVFDLTSDPLCRIRLVKLAGDHYLLLLTIHHIISDGWSIGVLLNEVTAVYQSFSTDQNPKVPELQIQYADFALWQRSWLQGELLEKQLAYWREQLREAPAALDLPTDYPRPAVQSFNGAQESVLLSKELSDAIKTLGQQEGVTLFMTLLAAFQTLLLRYSGQDDIVVGSPIAGRTPVETEALIGFFVNTLVLRTDLSGNPSFRELLGRTREAALGAYTHQDLPFEKLVAELHPERSLDRTPLFQVMFALQNAPVLPLSRVDGMTVTPVELNSTTAKFDLTLNVIEEGRGLRVSLEYNTDLFAAATIGRMLGHFQALLKAVAEDAWQRIADLVLLTEKERRQLLVEWNDTETEYPHAVCLHQLFESQVTKTPAAIAVTFEDEQITYYELNRRANQLAQFLRKQGVGPEVLVGICVERSLEMLIGLLGILKSGGAYVPLDPAFPKERLALMIEDANVPVLLTQQKLSADLPAHQAKLVCLDADWETIAGESTADSSSVATSDNLAYVIYTSGSTGKPKGAMITHEAICNRLFWMQDAYQLDASDRVLQKTPFSFDVSVWEFFWPLITGATLVVARPGGHQDSAYLSHTIREQRITTMHFVPSMLAVFLEEQGLRSSCSSLRRVICSGEALPYELQERFFARLDADLHNLYGPTEAAVDVTFWQCERGSARQIVPIGRPISNIQMYALDADMRPVPVGVAGELHIGGIGLARGYFNRPELTAEKFVSNPFSSDAQARLYKTGDLARYLPDGTIEYLGRIDDQVKLRGFRIELGEIESTLRQHAKVRESVVVAREDTPGNKILVGYVVPVTEAKLDSRELRAFLQDKLPEYMVPAILVELPELPLTSSGKVNRRALPSPDYCAQLDESYAAPRTPVEELLSNIWMEVLKVSRVGINDNFFDLGGHSLLATQVVSRIRNAFKIEMPLRVLFERPTVALMAEAVQTGNVADRSLLVGSIESVEHNGTAPLSFTQQQFWLLDQAEPNSSHYNVRTAIRITGPLDVPRLQKTFEAILVRHEILRTTFILNDGSPVQVIAPWMPLTLGVLDFSRLSASEHEIELQSALTAEAEEAFDLAHGPLLRIKLLKRSEDEHVLLVTVHHIICDAWSIALLQRELATIYQLLGKGESFAPRLQLQYADFAVWQRSRIQGKVIEEQLDYWTRQLASAPATLELPTDYPRQALQTFNGAQESLLLSADLSHAIKTMSRREGTTLFMTLLAAFQALLFRYSGQDDVVVGSPVAGRTLVETENLIGAFVNTVVFRGDLSGNPTFREFLGQVRETALEAYAHQEVPFEKLVEELRPDRVTNRTPLFQVMFALQNTSAPELVVEGLTLTALKLSSLSSKFDLTLEVEEEAGDLRASLKYNTDLFAPATIDRMLRHLQKLLEGVVVDPEQRVADFSLLSDAERQKLLVEWNDNRLGFPRDVCIHHLFEVQAAKTPDAIAAEFQGEQLTYRELNARANRLAHYLRKQGVGPEVRVGICIGRSLEMLVGILGVLKAGGAYVPLDPTYPRDRIAFMIEDAELLLVLTRKDLAKDIPGGAAILCIDVDWEMIAGESDANPLIAATASNVAYVIYTSGSTGNPKGVMIEHRSLVNFTVTATAAYQISPADRILQFASLCFDLSVEEIFPALTRGATIVLRTEEMISSGREFLHYCDQWGVTILDLPTAYWHELTDALSAGNLKLPAAVRLVIIGGEKAASDRVVAWHKFAGKRVRLVNTYGPTETTVAVTMCDLRPQDESTCLNAVPIGRPLANATAYLLDESLRPVPIGAPGELYIGGPGVARGYVNRPDLTSEKFIPDPFGVDKHARLYKTGDLARYRSDGNIEFLGRVDNQIKIRGFRVELEEIEQALRSLTGVTDCVVVLREDSDGDKRLIAYVVLDSHNKLTTAELRNYLKTKLPSYMVPAVFETIEALPLLPSGKINRRALPEPGPTRCETNDSFVAPRTPIEQLLAVEWCDVLKLERIGIHDNFFELGGHSLLAAKVVSNVRNNLEIELAMVDLFQAPTIASLAAMLFPRGAQNETEGELATLLGELANLTDEEAQLRFDSEILGNGAAVA